MSWYGYNRDQSFSVGPTGRFLSLQEAFDDLAPISVSRSIKITIVLQKGYEPKTGLKLFGGDWSNFIITSEDAIVKISKDFPAERYSFNNHFLEFNDCHAPTVDVFFDANNIVDRGVLEKGIYFSAGPLGGTPSNPVIDSNASSYASGIVYENSRGRITSGSGFHNCLAHGLLISRGSSVVADETDFSHNGLFADCGSQRNGSDIKSNGIGIRFNSQASLIRAKANYCGRNGIQTSTGSTVCARGAIACFNDRYGIRATQGGFHDIKNCTATDNGSYGVYSSFGSHVFAGNSNIVNNNRWKAWKAFEGPWRADVACLVGGNLTIDGSKVGSKYRSQRNDTLREITVHRGGIISAHNVVDIIDSTPGTRGNGNASVSINPNETTSYGIIFTD